MDILEEYAKEIGVSEITLKGLIDSHRYLRSQHKLTSQERLAAIKSAQEVAANAVLKEGPENYIHLSDLREMSIQELCELLSPPSENCNT